MFVCHKDKHDIICISTCFFVFFSGREYKCAVDQNDIAAVKNAFCVPPLERGCEPDELEQLNVLIIDKYGYIRIPLTKEDALEMYLYLIDNL